MIRALTFLLLLVFAACSQAGESGLRSMYLNVANEADPNVLTGLESMGLLAIDNVDRVARSGAWDEPLFHLLNEYYRGSGSLVLAADCPPGSAGFHLADLASRAAGAVVYRLHPLSDEGQLTALMLHARVRGLDLDAATAGYLFTRVKREMTELCEWLDYIDKESLAAQRKITIPFVRQLLEATPS